MPTAQFPPGSFVDRLARQGFAVPDTSHRVLVRRYLCSNPGNGGNASASRLMNALLRIVRGTPDHAPIRAMGAREFERLFTGQGKPEHFQTVLRIVWNNRDALRDHRDGHGRTPFARYFDLPNPVQAMADDCMFGMDCVGFAGRYLEASGVLSHYPTWYPRNYADHFTPVTRAADVDDLCALIWVTGSHVAIINRVVERIGSSALVVDVCQSSSGEARGPQANARVRLRVTSGAWLDFGAYGRELGARQLAGEERRELIARHSHTASTVGYRGGIFFDISHGSPRVPVGGHVYVGKLPRLRKAWDQPAAAAG